MYLSDVEVTDVTSDTERIDGAIFMSKANKAGCSSLIVFGDSLSDDGIEFGDNSYGFERNCNGPVWPEYLSQLLSCKKYINYAYSGAKSGYDNVYFTGWSGLLWQFETFINNTPLIPTGMIIIMNIIDPTDAPGMQSAELGSGLIDDVSQLVVNTNSRINKMIINHKSMSPKVALFDLNSILLDLTKYLNKNSQFTYQKQNFTLREIFDYAYYDLWNPTTFVHYNIALKLIKLIEDI
ncbi:unnamed protein product [Dracunculus medinensis]|uniref:SGNH_hydro domain-containing protein n=1 Tax=Dracunculus medinensis TaxID=318479 RepID=A0A0N4UJI0_DRAME|nr:unnamed protein product [Dracunculus medinensis]